MGCVFIFSGAGCGCRAARTRPLNAEDAKIKGGQKHRCWGSWEAIGRSFPDLPHFLGPCLCNHAPQPHTPHLQPPPPPHTQRINTHSVPPGPTDPTGRARRVHVAPLSAVLSPLRATPNRTGLEFPSASGSLAALTPNHIKPI